MFVNDHSEENMTRTRDIEMLRRRVEGEYREMPGLNLTRAQAQRLLGLDERTCDALLDALIAERFLIRTRRGTFKRPS